MWRPQQLDWLSQLYAAVCIVTNIDQPWAKRIPFEESDRREVRTPLHQDQPLTPADRLLHWCDIRRQAFRIVKSSTLAANSSSGWIRSFSLFTPIYNVMPWHRWLPFLVWCISGSQSPFLILGKDGCRDDGGIDDPMLLHRHLVRLEEFLRGLEKICSP